tara:strand:+ start:249 stop:512 length:264 start_codon:yes stop_codon:yes gene_type:complete
VGSFSSTLIVVAKPALVAIPAPAVRYEELAGSCSACAAAAAIVAALLLFTTGLIAQLLLLRVHGSCVHIAAAFSKSVAAGGGEEGEL